MAVMMTNSITDTIGMFESIIKRRRSMLLEEALAYVSPEEIIELARMGVVDCLVGPNPVIEYIGEGLFPEKYVKRCMEALKYVRPQHAKRHAMESSVETCLPHIVEVSNGRKSVLMVRISARTLARGNMLYVLKHTSEGVRLQRNMRVDMLMRKYREGKGGTFVKWIGPKLYKLYKCIRLVDDPEMEDLIREKYIFKIRPVHVDAILL